jgi:hypothetical protein
MGAPGSDGSGLVVARDGSGDPRAGAEPDGSAERPGDGLAPGVDDGVDDPLGVGPGVEVVLGVADADGLGFEVGEPTSVGFGDGDVGGLVGLAVGLDLGVGDALGGAVGGGVAGMAIVMLPAATSSRKRSRSTALKTMSCVPTGSVVA